MKIALATDAWHPQISGVVMTLTQTVDHLRRMGHEAFLTLDLPGTKYVVGDGPQLKRLMRAYPNLRFVGAKKGEALAKFYAAVDVFVFPNGKKVPNSFSITLFR